MRRHPSTYGTPDHEISPRAAIGTYTLRGTVRVPMMAPVRIAAPRAWDAATVRHSSPSVVVGIMAALNARANRGTVGQ